MPIYPFDTEENKKERKAFRVLFSQMDSDVWSFVGKDIHDHGVDLVFEYIENLQYKGYRALCQVKGRSSYIVKSNSIVFDFPVKTANYAIRCKRQITRLPV